MDAESSKQSTTTLLPDPDEVAALVVAQYARLPQRFRVKSTEWTVLCGIVAQFHHPASAHGSDRETKGSELKLISMGTGTKCLASASMVDGFAVRDCHAETIARRGLNVVLMDEIQQRLKQPQSKPDDPFVLLETSSARDDGTIQFRLRDDVTLHMFISDSPCGCASEFDRINGESRRVTGAKKKKRIEVDEGEVDPLDLRTKSGRSDLPAERQTRCMSCSDKLCKWAAIGLQSSILALSGLTSPIRLTSVVLGRDAVLAAYEDPSVAFDESVPLLEEAVLNVRSALESSFLRADRALPPSANVDGVLPIVQIATRTGFPNSRQRIDPPRPTSATVPSKPAPSSGVALTWIVKGGRPKREPCSKACGGGFAETLVGVRGVREGASKSASSKSVASDLAKAMWFQWYLDAVCSDDDERARERTETTYRALKLRAKWHRDNLDTFRTVFPGWNHNERFDEFHLS